MRYKTMLLFFSCWLFVFSTFCAAAIPQSEREALIALYNATNGSSWTNHAGWKTPPLHNDGFSLPGTEANWFGVSLKDDHVSSIRLNVNNLTGTLPPQIGDLQYITLLWINGNKITGPIPKEVGTLDLLEYMSFGNNQFSGSIPPELGNMDRVKYFYLNNNKLTGIIPPELGKLDTVLDLWVNGNDLSGTIPPELGSLTLVERLFLGCNPNLSGPIPPELGNLANLKIIELGYSNLSGTIPPVFGNCSKLERFHAGRNRLTGTIPIEFSHCTQMKYFLVCENQLTGTIPVELVNMRQLIGLWLNDNKLTGTIPVQLTTLTNLEDLILNDNQLTGIIPPQLANLTKLTGLSLFNNCLTGSIPPELGNLTNLSYFRLGGNKLEGRIPDSLLNLRRWNSFEHLSYNMLYTDNDEMRTFLTSIHLDWEPTQTRPPTNLAASATTPTTIHVTWDLITFLGGGGGYRVYYSTVPGGPYTFAGITPTKYIGSFDVTGLEPGTTYYLVVASQSNPNSRNQNTLITPYSEEVSATTPLPDGVHLLTVQSSPANGVGISLSPADNKGNSDGLTAFTRIYNEDTIITLTAPTTFDNKIFSKWIIDGSDNTSAVLQVTMNANHSATALYIAGSPEYYNLIVESTTGSGAAIAVTPADKNGLGNGSTKFTRVYAKNTIVTLIAPPEHRGKKFDHWKLDGKLATRSVKFQFKITGAHKAKAFYTTPSRPGLVLSHGKMNFTYTIGGSAPQPQTLRVTINGTPVSWTAGDNAAWLALSPTSGKGTKEVTVSVLTAGLTKKTYSGVITVTAPDADNSPQKVSVTLTVIRK